MDLAQTSPAERFTSSILRPTGTTWRRTNATKTKIERNAGSIQTHSALESKLNQRDAANSRDGWFLPSASPIGTSRQRHLWAFTIRTRNAAFVTHSARILRPGQEARCSATSTDGLSFATAKPSACVPVNSPRGVNFQCPIGGLLTPAIRRCAGHRAEV